MCELQSAPATDTQWKQDGVQDQFSENAEEEEKDFTGVSNENLMPFKRLLLHLGCFFKGKYGLFVIHS